MRISDWSSDVCSSDLSDYDDLVRLSGVSQTICEGFHGRVVMCSDEGRRQPIAFSCVPSGTEVSCPHSIQRSCIFPSGLRSRRSSLIPPRRAEERRVGKEVSVRVDLGGGRIINKKKKNKIK